MKLSIARALESVRAYVSSCSNVEAFLGTPDDDTPGIYIFPFHFRDSIPHQNLPGGTSNILPIFDPVVRCLMVTNPANKFGILDDGLKCIVDRTLVIGKNESVKTTISNCSVEELTQIFLSAGVSLRLAVVFDVRVSSERREAT